MAMATNSAAGGDIEVMFLRQIGDDPFTATPERTAQIADVAKLVADFIAERAQDPRHRHLRFPARR